MTPAALPENPKPKESNLHLVLRMAKFIGPVRRTALIACLLVAVWAFVELRAISLTGDITNRLYAILTNRESMPEGASFWQALKAPPLGPIVGMILALGILVLLSGLVRFGREYINAKFSMDMVYHMRAGIYDRLQRVGFGFHDEHSSGALINRAFSDLQNVRAFLQVGLILSSEIVVFVIGSFLLLLHRNAWIALLALLPVPFWVWYILRFGKKIQAAQMEQMRSGDDVVTVVTENVSGVHVVKAFATEQTEIGKYNAKAETYFERIMEATKLWRNFVPIVRGTATASQLMLLAAGAVLVVRTHDWAIGTRGRVDVGDLQVFGMALGQILSRLQQINQITEQYQKAIVSARRFYEVLDAPPTVPEERDAPALPPRGPVARGAVEFHFVTFGYDPERPVVHDISFDVPAGSIVALVGPTGAGKSTIVQLLARFYDPQRGRIFIDGVDIQKAALASVRGEIGFVFQETFLFSDTVANNIRYGKPEASLAEVEAAARTAQAHEFIMELSRGYDTMLGERGATLSGGQRQRLAIARAIVSNPRVLVLDDALAAVDPETEHLISRALELVMVDRTVFIIAHRLSTVKAADLVIVLEKGRITQAGTHSELMQQQGHYRHIAEVQLAYQEKELAAKAEKKADIAAGRE
jgi:ATP-binding cassette subfamily B protein/subfamily B ATP-binding cassette protein MsbA